MASIDEDGETDPPGATEIGQRIHRGSDRPPGEQDVVDEDHGAPRDVERDPGLVDLGRLRRHPDVVAIERDVQDADRYLCALDRSDLAGEAEREVVAPVGDADQDQALGPLALHDLVSDPGKGSAHVVRAEDPAHTGTPPRAGEEARRLYRIGWLPSRPHGTGLKGEVQREDTPVSARGQRA